MTRPPRDSLYPALASLLALAVFLPGIGWGLPSRDDDRYLFGDRTPWTGAEVIALAGGFDAAAGRGADVDVNPVDRSAGPVVLNHTDAKRAEIVRRFRLQSHQPDEFINFAAIAGMGQRRDLDPRLYQYGGLWLYPVAGLLGAAHVVGYVHLTGDLAWYLDRPAEFGKFYVVARLYSAAWGTIGAAVVFLIVRRLMASNLAGFCGAVTYALMPVVVTAAHEAKPHLAGAVLVLWAVLKADDYVRTGRRRDALWAGVLCGAASATVVSMVVSFALLPVMGHLRWSRNRDAPHHEPAENTSGSRGTGRSLDPDEATGPRPVGSRLPEGEARRPVVLASTTLAALVGLAVYAATNPYVAYNLLFDRTVFQSNIGNSTAMYSVARAGEGFDRGMAILALATGWPTLIAGVILTNAALAVVFVRARFRHDFDAAAVLYVLLLVPGGAVALFFFPLAAGKSAEYARFGLVLAAAYACMLPGCTALLLRGRGGRRAATVVAAVAAVTSLVHGVGYVVNFVADGGRDDTRLRAAARLAALAEAGQSALSLAAEPAPWSGPPFDLWHWRATLGGEADGRVVVQALESTYLPPPTDAILRGRFVTPISWANRPIRVWPVPVPTTRRGDE